MPPNNQTQLEYLRCLMNKDSQAHSILSSLQWASPLTRWTYTWGQPIELVLSYFKAPNINYLNWNLSSKQHPYSTSKRKLQGWFECWCQTKRSCYTSDFLLFFFFFLMLHIFSMLKKILMSNQNIDKYVNMLDRNLILYPS